MKHATFWIGLLLLFSLPSCDDDGDADAVADLECNDLIDEIYTQCDLRLPLWEGDRPDAEHALQYCREDERYDWACVDDCVFDDKRLCTSLEMCLDDCPLKD